VDERGDHAFRVADARRDGTPRRALDHAQLERPFTGLRAEPTADPDHARTPPLAAEKIRRAARHFTAHIQDGEFFSHRTAAVLWDLPLPLVDETRIDVSVLAPRRAPTGRGVRGHQLAPAQVTVDRSPDGMPVASAASTWAQLGGELHHLYDLTAVADALIVTPRVAGPRGRILRAPRATVEELAAELARGRRVGIRRLEDALSRARAGSMSRTETWTRLTLIDGGLPEPALDHDVYDEHDVFVGCVDLAYISARVAIEYEGDHHRVDARQWHRDIEKHDRLAEVGWRVIRVTKTQLFQHPGELVARVRTALRSRA
jgi:hypothetical protein